jgi:hypothetical protein
LQYSINGIMLECDTFISSKKFICCSINLNSVGIEDKYALITPVTSKLFSNNLFPNIHFSKQVMLIPKLPLLLIKTLIINIAITAGITLKISLATH